MRRPTLEEVKEYFKDAEKCISLQGRKFTNNGKFNHPGNKEDNAIYAKNGGYEIWNACQGYAKILSYKTPQYTITKEQIINLNKYGNLFTSNSPKDMFPDAFKTELEVGKWYKTPYCGGALFCVTDLDNIKNGHISGYGTEVSYGWQGLKKDYWYLDKGYTEATQEEVKEALISELIRLGVKKGAYFNCLCRKSPLECFGVNPDFVYNSIEDIMHFGGVKVYEKGVFAERVNTITKEEAERQLNAKII